MYTIGENATAKMLLIKIPLVRLSAAARLPRPPSRGPKCSRDPAHDSRRTTAAPAAAASATSETGQDTEKADSQAESQVGEEEEGEAGPGGPSSAAGC